MTTRNLDALFDPEAIALIGASNEPGSVGAVLARNLIEGGFRGPVMPVNPHETAIRGVVSFRSIKELPRAPELAVVATPPATVHGLIAELAACGCRAAVVITAGFGEGEEVTGAALREDMLRAARVKLMRIVGPNCLGFISPKRGIQASFAHLPPKEGDIAFITQSGAIATALIDWAAGRGIGFSHLISLGDMSDVDFGDLLDYLALDGATRAILLYVESVTSARKFMSAARIASRAKPVIVVKSGRTQAGARAAVSHTGALAGSDAVYDAAFRRAGMLRVYELRELFEAAEMLATGLRVEGDRLLILTNGGGAGVLAADALVEQGGSLAELSPETMAALNAVLPKSWSHGNPVDILGDARGARYTRALDIVMRGGSADAVLAMNCPVGVVDGVEVADSVIGAVAAAKAHAQDKGETPPPVLTCWLGAATASLARRRFFAAKVPTYETPDEAVRAFMMLARYRRNQALLLETPGAGVTISEDAKARARRIVESALREGRTVLTEPEAKSLVALYGIPVAETRIAKTADEAAAHATALGDAVALKILSRDITHKSDVGGVRLELRGAAAVKAAAAEMLSVVRERAPKARLEGFTVQPMIARPKAHQLIAGASLDATFGPVLLFGEGGVAVEVKGDRAMGLPPLNTVLARELISRTRIVKLLQGYRDVPPAKMETIEEALVRLSDLIVDFPEVSELDINPLLADDQGVIALDARVVVRPAAGAPQAAIRPYPSALAKEIALEGGRRFLLRPIRPEDEPLLVDMVKRSKPEDLRLRFFGPLAELPHARAARLSQIDYDREMALVALTEEEGRPRLAGVVRLIADPNNEKGEYAVIVRSDMKGQGLGYRLMQEMLAYARARGLALVFGEVLRENTVMLQMARELGGVQRMLDADARVVEVVFDLARKGVNAKPA
jgi:acetyltransferase